MRGPIRLLLLALVCSFACLSGQSSAQNPLEEAAWLIGTWEADFELPEGVPELGKGGEKVHQEITWQWDLDKKVVVVQAPLAD